MGRRGIKNVESVYFLLIIEDFGSGNVSPGIGVGVHGRRDMRMWRADGSVEREKFDPYGVEGGCGVKVSGGFASLHHRLLCLAALRLWNFVFFYSPSWRLNSDY